MIASKIKILLILSLLTCFLLLTGRAQMVSGDKTSKSVAQKVDELFAGMNNDASPGAAVVVIKDGKIICENGYGMADLASGVKISPSTIFHVGSVSKQFTAMAVQLLVQDGKLSLDDDVRKFLPELYDFGQTITIRHLLNHTSGLREQLQLLFMSGWRLADVTTRDDILRLV